MALVRAGSAQIGAAGARDHDPVTSAAVHFASEHPSGRVSTALGVVPYAETLVPRSYHRKQPISLRHLPISDGRAPGIAGRRGLAGPRAPRRVAGRALVASGAGARGRRRGQAVVPAVGRIVRRCMLPGHARQSPIPNSTEGPRRERHRRDERRRACRAQGRWYGRHRRSAFAGGEAPRRAAGPGDRGAGRPAAARAGRTEPPSLDRFPRGRRRGSPRSTRDRAGVACHRRGRGAGQRIQPVFPARQSVRGARPGSSAQSSPEVGQARRRLPGCGDRLAPRARLVDRSDRGAAAAVAYHAGTDRPSH